MPLMFRRDKRDREDLVRTIRQELAQNLKRGDEGGLEFLLDEDIFRVWTPARLLILSRGLDWADSDWQHLALTHFRKVLSILVYIHWDDWGRFKAVFLNHFGRNRQLDRTDEDLPFAPDDNFLHQSQRWEFLKMQYIFIPVVLAEESKYDNTDAEYNPLHRMPFLASTHIGEGATGVVSKALVAARHFKFERQNGLSDTPIWVASKYIERGATTGQNTKNFAAERKALRSFKECLERHDNIMHSYAIFTHGSYFVILSPLADLDLSKFLKGDYTDFAERRRIFTPVALLREAACLAGALHYLHHGLRLRDKRIACAHLDFKPDNILVKWSVDSERMPVGQWLVHDFGTTRIKESSEEANALAPGDFLAQFSLTKAQRSPGPFQAPEVQRSQERVVGRESDMWSFGCLLAVVQAFAIGGPRYVTDLGRASYNHDQPNQIKTDYFYTFDKREAVVKPTIVGFLNSLKTDSEDGAWIKRTLNLVFELLVDIPTSRLTAQQAQDEIDLITSEEERFINDRCSWIEAEVSLGQSPTTLPIREHSGLQHVETPPRSRELSPDPTTASRSAITDASSIVTASTSDHGLGLSSFAPTHHVPPRVSSDRHPTSPYPSNSTAFPQPGPSKSNPMATPASRKTNTRREQTKRGTSFSNDYHESQSAHGRTNSGSTGTQNGASILYQGAQSSWTPRQMEAPLNPTHLQTSASPRGINTPSHAPDWQPPSPSRNPSLTSSMNPSIMRSDTSGFEMISPSHTYPTSPGQSHRSHESSSFGSGSTLTPDVSFLHLMAPHRAFKSFLCPISMRVASLSKTLVLVPNFSFQTWTSKRPPKSPDRITTGFAAPQHIQYPAPYEWDMMSLCRDYIVLRARHGGQSKFSRFFCHRIFDNGVNLEIWNEDPFSTSFTDSPAPGAINGIANHVVDVCVNSAGDTLFVLDQWLFFYSSTLGLHTLQTQGQLRKACFSSDGQYVFAWTLSRDSAGSQNNRWYIWLASDSTQIMDRSTRRITVGFSEIQGRGYLLTNFRHQDQGVAGMASYSHWPDLLQPLRSQNRLSIIGNDPKQSQVVQLTTAVEDVIAGTGYDETESQPQGLILVQGGASPRLVNLPLLADVQTSTPSEPQKLKEGYNADTHGLGVVVEEQATFVAVSHPSGLIERRKITT